MNLVLAHMKMAQVLISKCADHFEMDTLKMIVLCLIFLTYLIPHKRTPALDCELDFVKVNRKVSKNIVAL